MKWPNGSTGRPTVVSAFGPRTSPTAGASSYHRGADFVGFSTIRAVAAGRVTHVGTPNGWGGGGTQVWVQHDGFFARYLHLVAGSPRVSVGQQVSEGQDLGLMGKTGTATGVHLHLEITPGNVHSSNSGQTDPVTFIAARMGGQSGMSAGTSKEWDEMASREEIKIAVAEALIEQKGLDGRNLFDSVIQTRSELRDRAKEGAAAALVETRGNDGRNILDGVIQRGYDIAELAMKVNAGGVDPKALADAIAQAGLGQQVADELAKRLTK